MAFMKKAIGKMRKQPMPSKQDTDEGMDPAFEIPDDDASHGDMEEAGGKEPTLEDGSPDDDHDAETENRAKRGDTSPEKRGAGHEDKHDELEKVSDQDLLKELKKRGHPAGAMHGLDKDGEAAEDEHAGDRGDSHEDAEEYSEED